MTRPGPVTEAIMVSRLFGINASLPQLFAQSSLAPWTLPISRCFHVSAVCLKQNFTGTVVSDKPDKTVIVAVERRTLNEKYQIWVRKRSKFMAHDELNEYKIGDKVRIEQHRPLSRHKKWMVLGYADMEKDAAARPSREAAIAAREAAKAAAKAALEAVAATGAAIKAGKTPPATNPPA